jgi:4-amino-4-deoxy-L-arabinose transferase-like glycosyltransferase
MNDPHTPTRASLLLWGIVALGAFLRFYQIGAKGVWIDEAFSIWMGLQPIDEILRWLMCIDQHPPLYYVLLHLWMYLGNGQAIVRVFSALCSTLTIPAIYTLSKRLANRHVALLAALLLTLSPFHIHFAQEARMYALLTLNASLSMGALARLLTDPLSTQALPGQQIVDAYQTWRNTGRRITLRAVETDLAWLGYVVFTAATLLTHNTAIFLPLATILLVLGSRLVRRFRSLGSRVPSLRNWLLAQAGVLFLWLPWFPAFITQSVDVYREFWLPAPTWDKILGALSTFTSQFLPQPFSGIFTLLALGLLVWGWGYFRHQPMRAAFLGILSATPFAGELLVSVYRPIFYDRTLIWASLPFYVFMAAGLYRMRRPLLTACLLVILAANSFSLYQYHVHYEKERWDEASAHVAKHVEPGDLILFNASWTQIPFDYYFDKINAVPVVEHGVPVDLFDREILEPKMTKSDLPHLVTLTRDHERVWLIYSHNWYTDPEGLIPTALEGTLDLQECWAFYGLQVQLYAR